MNIKEAEEVGRILENINIMKGGPDSIRKLFKSGEYEKIANIAIELYQEIQKNYENELIKFPSPIKPN